MAETYILKLAIDDSKIKELEQKLNGIFGGSTSSNRGSNTDIVKNITKLGAIAAGITGLVGLVKKISEMTISASPMLQSMLKLLDTTVLLILRPIGDFIGFTLRPILMYFLMYVALPFYRYYGPFMQKYGNQLGQWIVNASKTVGGVINTISNVINPIISSGDLAGIINKSGIFDPKSPNFIFSGFSTESLTKSWTDIVNFFSGASLLITGTLQKSWDSISGFFFGFGDGITKIVSPAWDLFYALFQGINGGIKILIGSWDKLYAFFSPISKDISDILGKGWKALLDFFKSIADFFKDPVSALETLLGLKQPSPTYQGKSITSSNIPSNYTPTPSVTVQSLAVNLTNTLGSDAQDFFKDPVGFVNKLIQTSLKRTIIK